MSWRIEVTHTSTYRYSSEVWASYNEVRMTPCDTDRQRVLASSFTVAPHTATHRYVDYWGTLVETFDLTEPHEEVTIAAKALVETSPPQPRRVGCDWHDVTAPGFADSFGEFLSQTAITSATPELTAVASELVKRGITPPLAADACAAWVGDHLLYQPGVTGVSTSAAEVIEKKAGVCQDFAHLAIALARAMGLPARYVSGYLHPNADGELGVALAGQSHAWIEIWSGEWRAYDPTNGNPVGERHVVVGRGRDYTDVPPLKGVYQGGVSEAMDVTVELVRHA